MSFFAIPLFGICCFEIKKGFYFNFSHWSLTVLRGQRVTADGDAPLNYGKRTTLTAPHKKPWSLDVRGESRFATGGNTYCSNYACLTLSRATPLVCFSFFKLFKYSLTIAGAVFLMCMN